MPRYRIYRLQEKRRAEFRWAPQTVALTRVKPRDYQPDGTVEAPNPYRAWAGLRGTAQALEVGDLLEEPSGRLWICKYVGFVEAEWELPEKASMGTSSAQGSQPVAMASQSAG